MHQRPGSALGAFLAGVVATIAVGGYYLFGPGGRLHRRQTERWLLEAKAEILERMGAAQDLTEDEYYRIVDRVLEGYGRMREVGANRAQTAAERFKANWERMRAAARDASADARRKLAEEDTFFEE